MRRNNTYLSRDEARKLALWKLTERLDENHLTVTDVKENNSTGFMTEEPNLNIKEQANITFQKKYKGTSPRGSYKMT